MKKIFFIILCLFLISPVYAGIDVDYNDGIYHIILSGKKIKKQINFICFFAYKTNKLKLKISLSKKIIFKRWITYHSYFIITNPHQRRLNKKADQLLIIFSTVDYKKWKTYISYWHHVNKMCIILLKNNKAFYFL